MLRYTLALAAIITLSASAQTVKPFVDPTAGSPRVAVAPAPGACFPKEAGDTGVNFKAATYGDGAVYTWYCGVLPRAIIVKNTSKPTIPPAPAALKAELQRLEVLYGYAADAGTYLVKEKDAQLNVTKPAK